MDDELDFLSIYRVPGDIILVMQYLYEYSVNSYTHNAGYRRTYSICVVCVLCLTKNNTIII